MINSKLQDIYCVYIEKVNNKIDIHDILYRVLHFLYYSQALFFLIIHITFYEQSIAFYYPWGFFLFCTNFKILTLELPFLARAWCKVKIH